MENQNNVLMEADHVKVYFKGKDKKSGTVKAVDDVSFQIMRGETFGVVGESGCGKSTLGRSLVRLLKPTDGHIYLDGTDIAGLKGKELKNMRKKAQIIFQDPSACLNPRRTVKQILMEPFEIHGLKGQMDVDARIEELMHLVGLDTYHLSRYPMSFPEARNSESELREPWLWSRILSSATRRCPLWMCPYRLRC